MEVELPEDPVYILADKILIQQVILNFILNAAQSMASNSTEQKKIIISQNLKDTDVIVSVRDFGEGIQETIREDLFRPFVTSKKEGFGVGLAISRSIIDEHQGKIWAENVPGGGAEFSFSIKTDGGGNEQ